MAVSKSTSWKQNLLQQLKQRNKHQRQCFECLIQAHNKLFDSTSSLKVRNVQLTVESERLKEENLNLQIRAETGASGAPSDRNPQLEQKLFKLQEELTELHRKRGENSQQIIDLNNALQEKEKELQMKEGRLSDASALENSLKAEIRHLESVIMELEATNQMLKDEHQALQLAFTALEEKYKKSQEDNNELVQRWMATKAKEADRINADNEIFMQKKQQKLQQDLAEALKENKAITEGFGLDKFVTPVCFSASLPNRAQCKLDAHDGEVNAIQWSPSGSMFASGGSDRKIKLWEYSGTSGDCMCKGQLLGSNAGITSLEFDPEAGLILGASNDFASRVWTIGDQRLRHTLTGHSGKVLTAKFLGESTKVVSGSHDRTLKIWDLHTKACIKTIFAGSSCNDLVTLHGTHIISGHFDKRVRFWDYRSDNTTNEIPLQGRISSLALSPERTSVLCCARDDTLKVLDLRMNQVSCVLCHDSFKVGCDWTRAVFSPDASYAMAGSQDGTLFIWNIATKKVEKQLKEHNHAIIACSWHPVGSHVVSAEKQKKVIVWSDI